MAALMFVFAIYLIYVTYFKIVAILFRGRQHNRFFALFLSTVMPVVGSFPAIIMASKYERRIISPASKMNAEILRHCITALQMVSVLILFLPFFAAGGVYCDGVNLIFGHNIAGSDMLKPAVFMIYLIIAPFVSAIVNIADRKSNIRNLVSYWISLLLCLSLLAIFLVMGTDDIEATPVFWLYCAVNVTVMLLSIFSMVIVRNGFLSGIEQQEKEEYIKEQKEKNRRTRQDEPVGDTYRCAKCGNYVKKGALCTCISEHPTLDRIMENKEVENPEPAKYCVYCKKTLADGEVCNCQGDGFGITVKSQPHQGRKCRYCGQILIGESTCVCEKILKNSQPAPTPEALSANADTSETEKNYTIDDTSNELAELEKKINEKFSEIKISLNDGESDKSEL